MHASDAMRVVVLLMADSQHAARQRVKEVAKEIRRSAN